MPVSYFSDFYEGSYGQFKIHKKLNQKIPYIRTWKPIFGFPGTEKKNPYLETKKVRTWKKSVRTWKKYFSIFQVRKKYPYLETQKIRTWKKSVRTWKKY